MKKAISLILLFTALCFLLCACGEKADGGKENGSYTLEANDNGVLKTYSYSAYLRCYSCEGMKYSYLLTLTGTMPNAAKETTFAVLSNTQDITFEQTYKQYISSDTADFFDPAEAVVVEMR